MAKYDIGELITALNEAVNKLNNLRAKYDALAAERDALRVQLAAAVPEGHVVVPRVATEEMIMAGAYAGDGYSDLKTRTSKTWTAMVEAAGKEPSSNN